MPVLLIIFFTYLDLPPSASLIVLWLCRTCFLDWTYTFDAKLVGIWDSLKTLIWLDYHFSSEGLSETFIGCKTLFRYASLFQTRKQIFYAMCQAMYDCARMKCPSIFWILFFFFIFPRFNECEMHMLNANAMIGLTNALCNHCAPICYWQTLNY